jgi:FkbM family methyltransferase
VRNGIPLLKLEEWTRSHDPHFSQVIIAIHNRDDDLRPIYETFLRLGFDRIISLVEFVNIFPNEQPFRYWLANSELYYGALDRIVNALSTLKDSCSVANYLDIIQYRLSGNPNALKQPSLEDQYTPFDCPQWPSPLRLIDCGAYDGDTIQTFAQKGFELEAIATFEPDPSNYRNLVRNLREVESINIPCATGAENFLCKFETGMGEAGAVLSNGNTIVQSVKIDDVLPRFRSNLIKMDVEGAEIDSLLGCKNVIGRYRPGLAISLYHRPTDLWEIPLLLDSWDLGYEFFIRCHRFNTFDSVLYAFPHHPLPR